MTRPQLPLTRRSFLAGSAVAGLAAITGCGAPAASGPPALPLRPGPMTLDLAGTGARTWGYGTVPGPEIRLRAGELLRVRVQNGLPDDTTVHWHGLAPPNAMDGVPGVTQRPIAPGGEFLYEFRTPVPGSFMYHAHVGMQLDRGLYGPLVVEPRDEPLAYDREHTLMLDDWADGVDEHRGHAGGEPGTPAVPDAREVVSFGGRRYPFLLVNGRPPEDPAVVEGRPGDRLRLRVMNVAADTGFRFAIAGHPLTITHTDGMPVEPVTVDALRLGMGERYDVLVDLRQRGGTWQIGVQPEGRPGQGRAVLRYTGSPASATPPAESRPAELDGRLAGYDELLATEPLPVPTGSPDRVFDLTLEGTEINGQSYPDADPLPVADGEWVRLNLRNTGAKWHPMHLHGHHFQVRTPSGRGPVKDTVAVPSRGGEVSIDFLATNPGRWLFHCHNHHHMEDGMVRLVDYGR
ncbi:multicopper oxidase family protein [Blastococcus saxobsidens]|uniref:Multicopper oxidase, type 3 n=1 Tax=Blastococcus saxobsidens (strain DD2) TaxID=1146883 RepID=H6RUP6_BLASD|nr:multicopper oxidase family protein [Blastococcus saxobsidens]CCG03213.1 Multicopper oxidase, type 3 [Blastococcus saxobsidens DD2]